MKQHFSGRSLMVAPLLALFAMIIFAGNAFSQTPTPTPSPVFGVLVLTTTKILKYSFLAASAFENSANSIKCQNNFF